MRLSQCQTRLPALVDNQRERPKASMSMMDDGNVNEVSHNGREAEFAETTMQWRIYQTSDLHIR